MTQQTPQVHKNRMANIELLRIISMMMVVSLHFLAKGNLLAPLNTSMNLQGYVAWLLRSFSIVAVDVYVIISGYFLVETGFRCKRIIQLVLQVMFYSILVPMVLISLGVMPVSELTFYKILQYIFLINMQHYWFVSAYILMYLFTPVLNAAVHAMKRQQLKLTIIILLIMESLIKTVIPVRLEFDNLGYDAIWFMVVYLIAAYIRLYGISFMKEKSFRLSLVIYTGLILVLYGLLLTVRGLFLATGKFEGFIEAPMGYNHLVTISAAVVLFYSFYHLKIEGKKAKLICALSPYTLGVYLLHEQIEVRFLWPFWLGAEKCITVGSTIFRWVLAIMIVMLAGIFIDFIRNQIFCLIGKPLRGTKLDCYLKSIDRTITKGN